MRCVVADVVAYNKLQTFICVYICVIELQVLINSLWDLSRWIPRDDVSIRICLLLQRCTCRSAVLLKTLSIDIERTKRTYAASTRIRPASIWIILRNWPGKRFPWLTSYILSQGPRCGIGVFEAYTIQCYLRREANLKNDFLCLITTIDVTPSLKINDIGTTVMLI